MMKNRRISINTIFEKDLVLKIISVLIGILIWFVVLDQQNPMSEHTLSVPLRTNKEVLAGKNISMVSSTIPDTINVVIKGRRQRLEKVSTSDFQAFLDFSGIESTEQTTMNIPIPQYNGDQDIIITDVYPKSVKISLEKIIRKEFPINIRWSGSLPEGYEAVNIKLNPDTVFLQDLESIINNIESVAVSIEREQLIKSASMNRRIEVYNKDGKIIPSLDGSFQTNISYNIAKTVPVATTVKGKPKEDFYVKDYKLSRNTVQIIGSYDIIKDISVINAEQLDVDGVEGSFSRELELKIPENVQLYNSNSVISAQVNIERYSYKTISIPKSSITIFGGDVTGRIKYRIAEDEISFAIKGPGEILNTVDAKTIKGFVNVSELSEDKGTFDVQISLPSGIYIDGSVIVTVETETTVLSEEIDEPEPTPSPIPDEETLEEEPFEKPQ
jgi:YbbR domain-containing protein